MSGTGTMLHSGNDRWRSIRTDPPPVNPVIPAALGSCTVVVAAIDYVARWAGYDTEECIEKAIEDGLIELDEKNEWKRDYDVYRFTAKGRRASDAHARGVFDRSEELARREREDDLRAASADPPLRTDP